jgi:hypothetical protein
MAALEQLPNAFQNAGILKEVLAVQRIPLIRQNFLETLQDFLLKGKDPFSTSLQGAKELPDQGRELLLSIHHLPDVLDDPFGFQKTSVPFSDPVDRIPGRDPQHLLEKMIHIRMFQNLKKVPVVKAGIAPFLHRVLKATVHAEEIPKESMERGPS